MKSQVEAIALHMYIHIISSAKEVLSPLSVCPFVCVGVQQDYPSTTGWIFMKRYEKMGLGPTYTHLCFESVLDHRLDKKLSKIKFSHLLIGEPFWKKMFIVVGMCSPRALVLFHSKGFLSMVMCLDSSKKLILQSFRFYQCIYSSFLQSLRISLSGLSSSVKSLGKHLSTPLFQLKVPT